MWFDWFLITWWGLGAVLFVALIGHKRQPIAPGYAVLRILIVLALVGGLLWSRGVL